MPKQTFFNLPEEKKVIIISAARKEFSRVSLYEVSIANIIRDAEIPRGSFYQYFENKEDLFFFVLEDFTKGIQDELKNNLKVTEGDLVESFILLFQYLLDTFKCQENKKFFKNIFLNMGYQTEKAFRPDCDDNEINKNLRELYDLIDFSQLNISKRSEALDVFKILMTITMQNIVRSFVKELSPEETVEKYKIQTNLIKKGIYKGDKQ